MSDKLQRFIQAGGDIETVPDEEWEPFGGTPLKDKVRRFKQAGGNLSTVTLRPQHGLFGTATTDPRGPLPKTQEVIARGAPAAMPRPAAPQAAEPPLTGPPPAGLLPGATEDFRKYHPMSPDLAKLREEGRRRFEREHPVVASIGNTLSSVVSKGVHGVVDPLQEIADAPVQRQEWAKAQEEARAEAARTGKSFIMSPEPPDGWDYRAVRIARAGIGAIPSVAALAGTYGTLDEYNREAEELGIKPGWSPSGMTAGAAKGLATANEAVMKPVEWVGEEVHGATGSETAAELAKLAMFAAGAKALEGTAGALKPRAPAPRAAVERPVAPEMPPARPAPPDMPPSRPVPERIPLEPVPERIPGQPEPIPGRTIDVPMADVGPVARNAVRARKAAEAERAARLAEIERPPAAPVAEGAPPKFPAPDLMPTRPVPETIPGERPALPSDVRDVSPGRGRPTRRNTAPPIERIQAERQTRAARELEARLREMRAEPRELTPTEKAEARRDALRRRAAEQEEIRGRAALEARRAPPLDPQKAAALRAIEAEARGGEPVDLRAAPEAPQFTRRKTAPPPRAAEPPPVEAPPPTPARPASSAGAEAPKAAEAPLPLDAEPGGRAAPPGERFATVDPKSLGYRPDVFQFKSDSNTLKGKKFRQEHAEPIDVWVDKKGELGEPGKPYVVDGHSRWNRAIDTKAPGLDVRYIEAPNAREAMLFGARKNLAADTVKVGDAARFFRILGLKGEALDAYLRKWDIPTSGRRVEQGKYVAELPDRLYDRYLGHAEGLKISESQAVELGKAKVNQGLTDAQLEALADVVRTRRVPIEGIEGLARRAKLASEGTKTEQSLFGETKTQQAHLVMEEKLERGVRTRLGSQKNLMNTAARKAAELEAVGNTIDAEASRVAGRQAEQARAVFERLVWRSGPINDAIREAAQRVVGGEKASDVAKWLDRKVFDAVEPELGKLAEKGPEVAKPVEPAPAAAPEPGGLFGDVAEKAPEAAAPAVEPPAGPTLPARRKTAPKPPAEPEAPAAEPPPTPPAGSRTKPPSGPSTPRMRGGRRRGERGSALVPIPEGGPGGARKLADLIRKEVSRSVKWLGEEFGGPGKEISDGLIDALVHQRANYGRVQFDLEKAWERIPGRQRRDVDARLTKMLEGREKPRTPAEENLVKVYKEAFEFARQVEMESGVRITDAVLRRRIFRKIRAQASASRKGLDPAPDTALNKFEREQVAEWEQRFGKGSTDETILHSPGKLRTLTAEYTKLAEEARAKGVTPERRAEINARREEIRAERTEIRQRYREMEQRTIHGGFEDYFPMRMSDAARELFRKRDPEFMQKLYEYNAKEFDSQKAMEREIARGEEVKEYKRSRARSFHAGSELPRRIRLPEEFREPSGQRAAEARFWSGLLNAAEHKVFQYRDPTTWMPRGKRGEGNLGDLLQKISESESGRGGAETARKVVERIMHRRAEDLATSNNALRKIVEGEGFVTAARLFLFNMRLGTQQLTQARNIALVTGEGPLSQGLMSASLNYSLARAAAYRQGGILGSTMYRRSGLDQAPKGPVGRFVEGAIELGTKPISWHDEFWRVVAHESAPHYADALIRDLRAGGKAAARARTDLKNLDITEAQIKEFEGVKAWGDLPEFTRTKFRQRVTAHANVEATVADRPRLLTNPLTKPIARLKTFGVGDARLAVNFAVKNAISDPKRLARYFAWTIGTGEVLNGIYESIWGPRDRPTMTEIANAKDEEEAAMLLAERIGDDLLVGSFLGILGSTALDMVSGSAETNIQRTTMPPAVDSALDAAAFTDDVVDAYLDERQDPEGSFWIATLEAAKKLLGRQVVFPGQIERMVEANTEEGQRERVRELTKVRSGVAVPRKGKERLRRKWVERLRED